MPEQRRFATEYIRFNSTVWSSDLRHVKGNEAVFIANHCFALGTPLFI